MSSPKARRHPGSRIVKSAEFRSTYQTGVRISSRFFVAFCKQEPNANDCSRFGYTCPRALGKAVTRNRIKRRMRAAVRLQVAGLSQGWVIVFNPRRTVLDALFPDLCREVNRIFIKCSASSSVS